MSNVFISYAQEDAPAARILTETLQRAGFSVWWDRHIPPGKTWDEIIGRELDTADCVLVLWSKISVASRWVREEAERSAARGCLIPVLVERVDPPFGFGRIHAADLSAWHGDEKDPGFAELCAAVSNLVKAAQRPPVAGAASPAHPPATAPALLIEAPTGTPPARLRFRRKVLWFAAGLLVTGVASVYVAQDCFAPRTAALPSVVGRPFEQAREQLISTGFTRILKDSGVAAEAEPGTVINQEPEAGTNLPLDSTVRLVVATPPRPGPRIAVLPSVVGRPFEQAMKQLISKGFRKILKDSRVAAEFEPGTVIRQDPEAGTNLPLDSSVRLLVATPPGQALLPPRQLSPASGTLFEEHLPRVTTLVWRPVPGAHSYTVEHTFLHQGQHCDAIARDGSIVTDLTDTTYTFNFVGAQPGCWRVWAVDVQGREGPKSPWWEFLYAAVAQATYDKIQTLYAQHKTTTRCDEIRRLVSGIETYLGDRSLVPSAFSATVQYPAPLPSPTIADLATDRITRIKGVRPACFQ
jgi:hypothetical protein